MHITIHNKHYPTEAGNLLLVDYTVEHNQRYLTATEGLLMQEHIGESFSPFMDIDDGTIENILIQLNDFENAQVFQE
jgi:hypothetical protein